MTPLRRWSVPFAAALLWGATAGSAHAATVEVATTVQAAVDAANSGDTVHVPAGTYPEHVMIDKDLTLRGDGASSVLRRAAGQNTVVTVAPTRQVSLEALTVAGDPLQPGDIGISAADVARLDVLGVAVTGNDVGVAVTDAADPAPPVRIRASRIAGNATGVAGTVAVDATRTWWGCNGGPGAPGCDTTTGPVATAPHLVLRLSSQFAQIATGGATTQLVADLTRDSAGGVSGVGFPDGTPIAFGAALGSLGATPVATASGASGTTLTSGAAPGDAAPTATLDGATVSTPVAFTAPPSPQAVTVTQTVTVPPSPTTPPPTTGGSGTAAPPTGAQLLARAREAFGAKVFRLARPLEPGVAYVPRSIRAGRGTLTVPDRDVVSLLVLACPATACDAGVSASVTRTSRTGRRAKPFALRRATFSLAAAGQRVVAVRLTPARRRAIRAARRATMAVTVAVSDGTGARAKTTFRVTLRLARARR